ncbi:MAG: hypothetical protein ABIT20_22075 [Gemmatimonadaceae bacterium]
MTAIAAVPCTSCQGGDLRGLERTRFFSRQIVTPDDLTQDQIYFREKSKRHNRMMHGWGVVCGACVRPGTTDCEVIIEPGYIMGPFGDEIVIDHDTVIDICKLGTGEQDGCCGDELDPWCSDTKGKCARGTLYLAVKYSECKSRPVRGGGGCGCGCDEGDCEFSRIRDSYTIKLLRDLPAGYTTPMTAPSFAMIDPCRRPRNARGCPPCPDDPWVILADISVDDNCKVRNVNCFTHRRYVVSFAELFFACSGGATAPGATLGAKLTTTAVTDAMRMMSMMSGTTNLVDTAGSLSGQAPRAMVTLSRADGSTTMLPAFFTVESGSTVADLLEREGDRAYYDPATDRTFTLREIYKAAGVTGSSRLAGTVAALSPLEGRVFDSLAPAVVGTTGNAKDVAAVRDRLRDTIDAAALAGVETDDDAAALPATSLAGVSKTSALGKRLAKLSIADVGAMTNDAFVAHATKGATTRQKKQIADQAADVWTRAQLLTSAYAPEPHADDE